MPITWSAIREVKVEYKKKRVINYPDNAGFKVPGSSEQAAKSIDDLPLRERVKILLRDYPDGLSADQAASLLNRSVLSIRPRFAQLKAKGEIEATGRYAENESGKAADIMRLKCSS
jgi:DNA-directed RNA polymerase specialized sigma24 family protein